MGTGISKCVCRCPLYILLFEKKKIENSLSHASVLDEDDNHHDDNNNEDYDNSIIMMTMTMLAPQKILR